jgi:sugar transport protein
MPLFLIDRLLTPLSTYLLFSSFSFSMFFFVWFFVPETKGRSLESMDELFGVSSADGRKSDTHSLDEKHSPEVTIDDKRRQDA